MVAPPQKDQLFGTLEATPLAWVETHDELAALATRLVGEPEIAIDLEAHSKHSYQGFVCLMQLSTRKEDYIIDTLALRGSMHLLNNVFTDPKTTKVLHGADSDIVWLQRDFGLYIVNLFDTGQAARVLEYPSFGLAYLLKHFSGVNADKKYQLADWRMRPLEEEMLRYAREDTHYLLYIYDRLKQELSSKSDSGDNLVRAVLSRSVVIASKRYEKPVIGPSSHAQLLSRHNYSFSAPQMRVFAAMYGWRDALARRLDEGVGTVLSNNMLLSVANTSPQTAAALLACCTPCPPILREHCTEAVQVIERAIKGSSSVPPSPVVGPGPATPRGEPSPGSLLIRANTPNTDALAIQMREKWQKENGHKVLVKTSGILSEPSLLLAPYDGLQGEKISKAQEVFDEIGALTVLDIVAQIQSRARLPEEAKEVKENIKDASEKVEVKKETEGQAEGASVSSWLEGVREEEGLAAPDKVTPAEAKLNKNEIKSVAEKYGGKVAKKTALRKQPESGKKRKKVTKVEQTPPKRAKAIDAMKKQSGADKRNDEEKAKEKAKWH